MVGLKVLTLEEAMESIPVSFFHYRLLLMCGLAFMADAMEVSLLSFLATCAGSEWNLNTSQQASITSLVFGGELLGSLFWGQFADRYGRKIAYLVACCLISVGGFLSGAAPSYEWLLVFRAIVGFGVGGLTVPFDLLAEFLPASHRGKYLNYIEYFWTLGSLFVSAIAWACLSNQGWRTLTYITAVPVTISSILSIIYLPESPRWLMIKGRVSEAEKIVKYVADTGNYAIGEFSLSADFIATVPDASFYDLVKSPKMRRTTFPLTLVWMSFGFTYYGIILFVSRLYSTASESGSSCSFDYQSIFINACAEFAGVTIGVVVIDYWGRRWTQGILYLAGGAAVFCMGLSLPAVGLLTIAWLGRMLAMASSSATWVATPELFPTEMRATGHSICNVGARLGAFCSPYFIAADINVIGIGIGLAVVNALAAFSSFLLPETTGMSLDSNSNQSNSETSLLHNRHPHMESFVSNSFSTSLNPLVATVI